MKVWLYSVFYLSTTSVVLPTQCPGCFTHWSSPSTYRVSQKECEILRESVHYVKLYRYNPKLLYPKLNGYGVNGHRKVWASVVSTNCTPSVTPYSSTAQARQGDIVMQWSWRKLYSTVALTSQDNERSGGLRKVLRSLRTAETRMREGLWFNLMALCDSQVPWS